MPTSPWHDLAKKLAPKGTGAVLAFVSSGILGQYDPFTGEQKVSNTAIGAGTGALVGAVGGAMVVPLNALLQHRGAVLLSAGRSIAVQGFNENASVLALVGVYALLTGADWPVQRVMWVLGAGIALAIGALWWAQAGSRARGQTGG